MKLKTAYIKHLGLILCLMASVNSLRAQNMGNYAPVRTTGILYSSIESSGNSFPSWRNNVSGNSTEDDNRSFSISIGFDFWYNGTRYTEVSVSTNGFIDFSSATYDGGPGIGARQFWPYGPYDQDLSSSARTGGLGGTALAIAPIYYDKTTQGELDPLGASIKYLVTGTAPNRILTIEWLRMAVWGNTTPSLNYQVKIYEGTGVIEMVYGTMTPGTVSWAYSSGLSGANVDAARLIQTTANSNTFSTTSTQNGLTTLPASNSMISFTPPAINAPYNLTYTGVTQTSMTLNWTDTLWNEVGFAIYRSDDGGATYNFITQTAANATSYAMTGLLAGTTYYYRVYAVNEGRLSSALTGNQATSSPGAFSTVTSGSWKNPLTWSTGTVPGISDNATIADGHAVYIDTTVVVNSITVGQGTSGTLLIGDDNTARSITVIGNIDIKAGGIFRVNPASNTSGHTITTSGNILNAGRFVMASDADSRCAVTFNKSGTQTISGSGDSSHFYTITLNMGSSRSNILDVFATNFTTSASNFLTITNGTFNLATGANVTPFTSNVSIPLSGGIRVNHASAVLNTTGGSVTVVGEFKVQNGTVNIGNNVDQNLISRGGTFEFTGGTTNVRGRFEPYSSFDITDFTMTGGTLVVADSGSTSTSNAPFTMNVAGSIFTMSGGTILVKKEGGSGATDLGFVNTGYSNYTVTGGTVQIGQTGLTPSAQIMSINSSIPLFDLVVNSSNATAKLITNNVTVLNDVTITLGALNANGLDMTVARNWTNSSQTFTPSTGKVTFNGISSQTITDALGETFNKIAVNKSSGTVTLANNVTVSDSFQLTSGTLDVSTSTLTLNGIVVGGGTLSSAATGTVNYNRSSAGQTVLTANYGNLTFSNFTKVLPASVVGIAGTFTPGSAVGHTITGNTIDFNGSGAQNISSFTYNNLTTSNGGTKTVQSGADTVLDALTIGSGTTFADNGIGVRVFGNITHNGSHTGSGSIILNGSTSQTISGSGSYQNLNINNANGVALSGDKTINGTLTFTTGVISTGTDTLTIASGGTVSRTSGHVNGWLKKNMGTGSNVAVTFEVGDAASANYTPASFTFATVTSAGALKATTVNSEHPDINSTYIDPTNNVNRYWQLINSGGFDYTIASGYNAEFTFLNPGDLDATGTESSFRMNVYNGTTWDSTTAGTRTATTNQATGVDSLGVYAVGLQVTSGAYRSAQTGDWNVASTWERFNGITWVAAVATPTSADGLITIRSGHTVSVTANVSIDQTVVESGGTISITGTSVLTIANGGGTDLTVNGTLQRSSSNNITTTGTIAVNSGGKYVHNRNGGNIPTATWNSGSTCEVTGVTNTVPGNRNQAFSNFTWNCTGQGTNNIALANQPATVNGNYTIQATGTTGQLRQFSTINQTLNIGGSLIISGGNFRGFGASVGGGTNGTSTMNIGDSYLMSGGNFNLSVSTSTDAVTLNITDSLSITAGTLDLGSGSSAGTINLQGALSVTGGTLTETGSGTKSINFSGTAQQDFTDGGTIANAITYTVNNNAILSMGASTLTGTGTFTLSSGASILLGSIDGITTTGATGNVQVTGTRTFNTGANYTYNGTSGQVTGNGLPATVNNLVIDNTAGVTLSSGVAVTDSLKLLQGDLAIGANTLTLNNVAYLTSGTLSSAANGTVDYNKSSNGQSILPMNYGNLTFSDFNKTLPSGTIGIAGNFTPGTATGHTTTGNTIDYNGSTLQNVGAWLYYNNLTISGTNWKVLTGNSTVNGNLSVANGTLSDSIYTLTVKGNISNSSVITGSGSNGKTLLTGGTVAHSLNGSGSYWILELDDSYGATSVTDFSISNQLTLTLGVLTTGSNLVICDSLPGIYRPVAGGHVNGRIRKNISASGVPENYTFEVGDASNYTPIDLTFQSVSVAGTVTAYQTASDHSLVKYSGLDQNKSVNRYYTLSGSGLTFSTYDATFTFVSSDIDAGANTAYFFVKRYNAPSWYPSTVNVRQSTSTRTLGITAFGDFAVGEASMIFYWTQGAGTYNWGDDYNWSSHSVPTAGNSVVFDGDDTVEVNVNGVCKDLTIQNDTLRLTILAGNTLTVNGNLTQTSGQFSTRGDFPTVTGSVSFTGGLFGYDSSGGLQTVSAQTYNYLRLSGGGTKTAAGAFTVNKNLTISSGVSFADGGFTITVKDSVSNNGTHSGVGKILLDGSVQHQITGAGSFTNLQLNNSSNGAVLDSNITINGMLTLSNGIITAPNDTLFISSTGTVVRTSGYINGNLRKYFAPASDSLTYEVGTASSYLPVTVSFGTITTGGNLTLSMIAGEHYDIANSTVNQDSSVNRYWVFNNNGIAFDTYNLTVNWLSSDVDAGISDFSDFLMAVRSNSGVWDELTSGTITSTSMRGMNGTSFSSFAVGKPLTQIYTSVQTGNWNTASTWDLNKVPKRRDKVIIASPHVVTMIDDRKISSLTINSGGQYADGGYTLDLYGNFVFSGTWSGSGRIRWNDNVGDTLSGSGGNVIGTSSLFVNGDGKLITAENDSLYRIQIATGNTITNSGSIRTTQLIGDASSSTWINSANASLGVKDTLLTTGTLSASANNNTVSYLGTGAQTIKVITYYHLTLSGGNTKSISSSISILGNVSIGSSTTFAASSTVDTLYGNWTNNGTFNASTSRIVLAGSSNATLNGVTTFNDLVVNKNSSAVVVQLGSNMQAANLAMTNGTMHTGSNTITITSTRTGNGIILGTITRTHTFTAGTAYAFEGPDNTLTFDAAGTLPTSITVFVDTTSPGANDYMEPINRYYTISQSGGSGFTYTMRLHYQNSEVISPNIKSSLKIWQRTSTGPDVWERWGVSSSDTVAYWVEKTGINTMGTWSLSSRTLPNIALTLSSNATTPVPGDTVTYTIVYSNTGDGTATNTIVSASSPLSTTYVSNSVTVNSSARTDASDADGVSVSFGNITINLGTIMGSIAPSANGTITYKVIIN